MLNSIGWMIMKNLGGALGRKPFSSHVLLDKLV